MTDYRQKRSCKYIGFWSRRRSGARVMKVAVQKINCGT
jgi:hypothetical protein